MIDRGGYIVRGSRVAGKTELIRLLKCWLDVSYMTTIGDTGTFGGSACILITLDNGRVARLNSDTKRTAVQEFVKDARARGLHTPWTVVPNRRGRINKVNFRPDGAETPGWYCYLREPLPAPQTI